MKNRAKMILILAGMAGVLCGAQNIYAAEGFSYADVKDLTFSFSSGVGAWGTLLYISEDGSFTGNYRDTNMGETGEGYSQGTVYCCEFSGKFTEPVQVNEYTYSAQIEDLTYEQEPGTTEIFDDTQWIYSDAYGLTQSENFLFYLEGAPVSELPEEYITWVRYVSEESLDGGQLPFIGLYNEAAQEGFRSFVAEPLSAIETELAAIEDQSEKLKNQMTDETDHSVCEMLANELYQLWDDELNSIWGRLKEILSADKMSQLTEEQLAWITEKETRSAAAGEEYGGGSLYQRIVMETAADITRDRVYILAEYMK